MSNRILRLNEVLKRELSQLLLREIEFPKDVLVTVTRVETLPDLSEAIVNISVMPETENKKVLRILNSQIYHLQKEINHKLRIRHTPKIRFCREESVCEAAKIEEVLEKIKKKP